MKVDTLVLGDFQTNSYVVRTDGGAVDCVVVDTGLSAEPLRAFIEEGGLRPLAVLLTHGHVDHIAGLNMLRERWPDIAAVIHAGDAFMLTNPVGNLSMITGASLTCEPADVIVEDQSFVEYAGLRFEVLHTPGHTPGGVSFFCPDAGVVFAGDALFAGSIGRTDFPGGNYELLIESIRSKLLRLPDETVVYTGHGPATTIAAEKQANQYLAT